MAVAPGIAACSHAIKMAATAFECPQVDSDSGSDDYKLEEKDCGEGRTTDDIQSRIWSALGKVETPSAFVAGGHKAGYTNPGLHIKNYGTIRLPLSENDAEAIISEAKQSPFGKGEHTMIDTSVRKSWELDAHEIAMRNPAWDSQVQEYVHSVCTTLGLTQIVQSISAEFYKLLLYEPGAFFKSHRDSEKTPGMFGTLIICLPSKHEGGSILLEHAGKKQTFNTESNSEFGISFAAWYADVSHEIMQVVSGYRLVLTYNLVRHTLDDSTCHAPLVASNLSARKAVLSELLTEYSMRVKESNAVPQFLLHKLKRKYTQASLKEVSLKGSDVSTLEVLKQLRQECKIDLYLATLELMVVKDDEGYDEEVERTETLSSLVRLNGSVVGSRVPLLDAAMNITDPRPRDEEDADEEEREGWTGNEGATATYWYRETVIVIVPLVAAVDFLCSTGVFLSNTLLLLRTLMERFSSNPHLRQGILKICKYAIKRSKRSQYVWLGDSMLDEKELNRTFFREAVSAMLKHNAFDTFQEACQSTSGSVALKNAEGIGAALARTSIEQIRPCLEQGLKAAEGLGGRYQFLSDVEAGMQSNTPAANNCKLVEFKQWSENMLSSGVSKDKPLTKSDCEALAQMSRTRPWPTFKNVLDPILTSDTTLARIAFLNQFLKDDSDVEEAKLDFARHLIRYTWEKFEYTRFSKLKDPAIRLPYMRHQADNMVISLNATDLGIFIQHSQRLFEMFDFEQDILPTLLNATLSASSEACIHVFPELIKEIAEDKFQPMTNTDLCPPSLHKTFVQSLLASYIRDAIGSCPKKPTSWTLSGGSCNCKDCSHVNSFLKDSKQKTLDFPCSKARRRHLDSTYMYVANRSCKVETIHGTNPCIWRMTKNHSGYDSVLSRWKTKWQTAKTMVETLTKDKSKKARLEAYLSPHFDAYMSLRVEQLPIIDYTASTPLKTISPNTRNKAPSIGEKGTVHSRTGRKRGSGDAFESIEEADKRSKTRTDESENLVREESAEIEIVDLTDL